MAQRMGFLTVRLDSELKEELSKASMLEHRSLSTFARLLLEYGWSQYLKAGTLEELISREINFLLKEEETGHGLRSTD